MQIRNSTRSTIGLLILIGILVLIGFTPDCQTTKENTLPEKINNPNSTNDAWGFIGAGGGERQRPNRVPTRFQPGVLNEYNQ